MGSGLPYEFHFDPETKIFYKKHFGVITKEEIFKSWDHAIENDLIPKDTAGFIVDFMDAQLNLKLLDVKHIPIYFNLHSDIFGNKKMAILVKSPEEIVVPVLIERAQKKYFLKPFSTETAAIKWILSELGPL
jgi:hypothetical protein